MKKVVTYGLYNNEKSIKDFEKQIQEYIKDYGEWKIVKENLAFFRPFSPYSPFFDIRKVKFYIMQAT